jgi:CDP-4-dehydro-6-deoxyglucose reductase
MTQHRVTTAGGKSFEVADKESILDAGLRAGLVLAYSCHTGRCSTCKGRVTHGTTVALHDEPGLSAQEKEQGWILTCVRTVATDAQIAVEDLGAMKLFPVRMLPARIDSLERLSGNVLKTVLRLPPGSDFQYYAGQYVEVIGPGGVRRSYSIANAPGSSKGIELHIGHVTGGEMSRYWFEHAAKNDLLRINGPLGTFFLRDVDGFDLVFLATGTGIAPVKAMLEALAQPGCLFRPSSITVLWGGRSAGDLYWDPRLTGCSLQYVPVLSRSAEGWTGACGYVQDVLLKSGPGISRMSAYACGSDAMIHCARTGLSGAGLPHDRFQSDAFVCSAAA